MNQTAIFGPFFATILLTLVVWVYMFARRVPFIQSSELTPEQLATPGALAAATPAAISNPSDNLKNLFEMPILFYALALFLFVTEQVDAAYVYAGWAFVGFRVLHSAVHCSFNLVILRFALYALSSLMVWFMFARAALGHLGG
jgi:hypothetical protein